MPHPLLKYYLQNFKNSIFEIITYIYLNDSKSVFLKYISNSPKVLRFRNFRITKISSAFLSPFFKYFYNRLSNWTILNYLKFKIVFIKSFCLLYLLFYYIYNFILLKLKFWISKRKFSLIHIFNGIIVLLDKSFECFQRFKAL